MDLEFWDCNSCFGLPSKATQSPETCATVDELAAALARAGIVKSIAWHIAQHDVSPPDGNRMLA
jgi:hypothetical protein